MSNIFYSTNGIMVKYDNFENFANVTKKPTQRPIITLRPRATSRPRTISSPRATSRPRATLKPKATLKPRATSRPTLAPTLAPTLEPTLEPTLAPMAPMDPGVKKILSSPNLFLDAVNAYPAIVDLMLSNPEIVNKILSSKIFYKVVNNINTQTANAIAIAESQGETNIMSNSETIQLNELFLESKTLMNTIVDSNLIPDLPEYINAEILGETNTVSTSQNSEYNTLLNEIKAFKNEYTQRQEEIDTKIKTQEEIQNELATKLNNQLLQQGPAVPTLSVPVQINQTKILPNKKSTTTPRTTRTPIPRTRTPIPRTRTPTPRTRTPTPRTRTPPRTRTLI